MLCENGKPEIFNKNRRFPAKMGGLESLYEVLHEVHNIKIHFIVVVVKLIIFVSLRASSSFS